jgi:hypothetical protein
MGTVLQLEHWSYFLLKHLKSVKLTRFTEIQEDDMIGILWCGGVQHFNAAWQLFGYVFD